MADKIFKEYIKRFFQNLVIQFTLREKRYR